MIEVQDWKWFGNAGHFICASHCRFHLTTLIGGWMVSTVGEYLPDSTTRETIARVRGNPIVGRGDEGECEFLEKFGFEKLGSFGTFETMVFTAAPCTEEDCPCGGFPAPTSWVSAESLRYDSAADATKGHYAFCMKAAHGEIAVAEE